MDSGVVEDTPPASELYPAAMDLAKSLRSKGKDPKTREARQQAMEGNKGSEKLMAFSVIRVG